MKKILTILFSAGLLFYASVSFASQAAPSPNCKIKAEVINSKSLKVISLENAENQKTSDGWQSNLSCKNMYAVGKTLENLIYPVSLALRSGENIIANVEFRGDEWSSGYVLSDVKLLSGDSDVIANNPYIPYLKWTVALIALIAIFIIIRLQVRKKK